MDNKEILLGIDLGNASTKIIFSYKGKNEKVFFPSIYTTIDVNVYNNNIEEELIERKKNIISLIQNLIKYEREKKDIFIENIKKLVSKLKIFSEAHIINLKYLPWFIGKSNDEILNIDIKKDIKLEEGIDIINDGKNIKIFGELAKSLENFIIKSLTFHIKTFENSEEERDYFEHKIYDFKKDELFVKEYKLLKEYLFNILKKIKDFCKNSDKDKLKAYAVIGVPPNMPSIAKSVYFKLFRDIGIDAIIIKAEPELVLYNRWKRIKDIGNYKTLIFDFGGGTFDICNFFKTQYFPPNLHVTIFKAGYYLNKELEEKIRNNLKKICGDKIIFRGDIPNNKLNIWKEAANRWDKIDLNNEDFKEDFGYPYDGSQIGKSKENAADVRPFLKECLDEALDDIIFRDKLEDNKILLDFITDIMDIEKILEGIPDNDKKIYRQIYNGITNIRILIGGGGACISNFGEKIKKLLVERKIINDTVKVYNVREPFFCVADGALWVAKSLLKSKKWGKIELKEGLLNQIELYNDQNENKVLKYFSFFKRNFIDDLTNRNIIEFNFYVEKLKKEE